MASNSPTRGFGSWLGAFVLGVTAGAAIALLTAPRTGRETRARLKDAARDLRQRMDGAPEAIRAVGARAMKTGQAAYEQARAEAGRSRDQS
jgi:gas vesicle protein